MIDLSNAQFRNEEYVSPPLGIDLHVNTGINSVLNVTLKQ